MPHERLTPALVERLRTQPGSTRTAFFDTHPKAPRGLALRVSSSGEKSWYLVATLPSTKAKAWVRLGDARTLSLDDAREAARAEAGRIALGRNPNEERRRERQAAERAKREAERHGDEPTVAGLVRKYVEARRDRLSPITYKEYLRTLAVDIEPSALGRMRAKDALRSHVREFHSTLGRSGRFQADRVLVILRAAYRWGADEEVAPDVPLVDRDPTRGVDVHMRGSAKVRTRSLVNRAGKTERDAWAEVVAFWSGTEKLGLISRAFVRLLLVLGLRRGEAALALWKDVDLDGEPPVWHVPAEVRKGRVAGSAGERRALDLPLPALAVRILRELREATLGSQRVFPKLWLGGLGAELKATTGLVDLTLHDLRRSMTSALQRLGAPPHVIAAALGHVETGGADSDAHYRHGGRFEEHAAWLRRWAEHIERLTGQGEGDRVVALPG
jgi:integrase